MCIVHIARVSFASSPIPMACDAAFLGSSSERNTILSDEGPMLETLDYTIRIWRIGSTPTFLYFDFLVQKSLAIASSYSYVYFVLFQLFSGMHHRHSWAQKVALVAKDIFQLSTLQAMT